MASHQVSIGILSLYWKHHYIKPHAIICLFRSGQPDGDDGYRMFVVITSAWRYVTLFEQHLCQQLRCVQTIIVLGTILRITYKLWNMDAIRWSHWNIATNKREVDYWKSKVITYGYWWQTNRHRPPTRRYVRDSWCNLERRSHLVYNTENTCNVPLWQYSYRCTL